MAPPDAPITPSYPLTWFTDRTRYTTGTGKCRYARYLRNHFGPTGYGIVRKAESLPLATGKHAHTAIEPLWGILRDHDRLPTEEEVRAALTLSLAAYAKLIADRGYASLLQSEKGDFIVSEQQALLTGLVWSFADLILPWVHSNYRILASEQEALAVLQRDPDGSEIALMQRQDCFGVPRGREDAGLAYFEVKTTGSVGEGWAQSWETRPQLAMATLGAEGVFGRPVTEHYIVGLYKGKRDPVNKGTPQEWYRQESPFCYGFRRPPNPPIWKDDWKPTYRYQLPDGTTKQVSRDHQKTFIGELATSDWEPAHAPFTGIQAGQSWPEWWARQLPPSVRAQSVFLIGPLVRQEAQINALQHEIVAEERDWQDRMWQLHEWANEHGWTPAELQDIAGELFPRSWDCRRFGTRYQCEYLPICFKYPGWEDPLATGKYVPRRPHHAPELEQAISRGLLPAEAEEGEEDQGGDD